MHKAGCERCPVLGTLGWPGDVGMLGTSGPREGGIPGWAGSGREPTRQATHGLLGMASQSSMAEPADLGTTNGVQACRGAGAPALWCLDGP